jgi:G:T-mismatch repair DNA endonuclease (very short patch repair protein)
MKILNEIKINGVLLMDSKIVKGKRIFLLENSTVLTSKEVNRKTKIFIKCSLSGLWIKRTYSERFLSKKQYVCPKSSVSAERNGMYGKHMSEKNKEIISKNSKGNKFRLGKKFTKEQRDKRSKILFGSGNSFYGKKHSEETIKRISKSKIGKGLGKENPFYGKKHSEDAIRKIKEKGDLWRSKNKDLFIESCKNGAYKSMIVQSGFEKKSSCETKVEEELIKRNLSYKYNKVYDKRYQYDFTINENILIEVQGNFWHANPKYYGDGLKPLNDIQKEKTKRDKEKYNWAITNGFSIYYIWEDEIKEKNFSVLDSISDNDIYT